METEPSLPDKATLRRTLVAARDAEPDRDAKSHQIAARIEAMPAFRRAGMVFSYVGVKSEVATMPILERALALGKRVAVPVCRGHGLDLVRIDRLADLAPAPFGLLEPPTALCGPDRLVAPSMGELVLVPGVGFDRAGGRLGYGRAYFDRLLGQLGPGAVAVGLAFECQVVDRIPMESHDVPMKWLATEAALYSFPV